MISRVRKIRMDEGVSLAELLVSMMIVSIVLVCTATLLVASVRQFRFSTAKSDSQADSRLLIEQVTRDLRVAVPSPQGVGLAGGATFSDASPLTMTFYTSRGGTATAPVKLTYSVDSTKRCLVRSATTALVDASGNASYLPANTKSRCVNPGRLDTSLPIFTYFTLSEDATVAAATLPADIADIGSVNIRLSVTSPNATEVPPTVVTQTVTLTNLSNAILGGQ